jgi:hypothetical protein
VPASIGKTMPAGIDCRLPEILRQFSKPEEISHEKQSHIRFT